MAGDNKLRLKLLTLQRKQLLTPNPFGKLSPRKAVAKVFKVKPSSLMGITGKRRGGNRPTEAISRARWALMLVMWERKWSYRVIAAQLSLSNKSIWYGVGSARDLCASDPAYAGKVESVRRLMA